MAARDRDIDRLEEPDVEIGAAVHAKKLRFKREPETEVKVHGESYIDERLADEIDRAAEIETASGSERHNLPEEVEPGETYHDVRVRWRAAAKIRPKKARKRRRRRPRSGS
jgi:hypothetical protein